MAKFKGYAMVTMRVPVSFELDDEDADDADAVEDNALLAAEDAVFGCDGEVDEVVVCDVEQVK